MTCALALLASVVAVGLAFDAGAQQDAAPAPGGGQLYKDRCLPCHQQDGVGAPGLAPPLAGTLAVYLSVEGGRTYLPQVVLSGISGPIRSQGQPYNSVMPGLSRMLSDVEIARVLNYVLEAYNRDALPSGHRPLDETDVAGARARPMSPGAVRALREQLLAKAK